MRRYSVIVVGAGPAGFSAAISAARILKYRDEVLLLEGGKQSGSKLLLSGSGQCNFTNALAQEDFIKALGKYGMYLKSAFYGFDNLELGELLAEVGCESYVREDGKVFPKSLKAKDVQNAFLKQLRRSRAELLLNAKLVRIRMITTYFEITLQDESKHFCDKLILCTGGSSYPKTGSDGMAVHLTQALGHHPIPFRPHLTSVSIKNYGSYKECAGISLKVQTSLITKNGKFDASGDLLLTHTGFSGPLILDNSHHLTKGDEIIINWCPEISALIPELIKNHPRMSVHKALRATKLPVRLLSVLLDNPDLGMVTMSELSKKLRNELVKKLSHHSYKIEAIGSLDTSMASAGGIPLSEINAKTMESRICPGLYFAGEIMDYALPTGGFNIQIACSTGWLAGIKAVESL